MSRKRVPPKKAELALRLLRAVKRPRLDAQAIQDLGLVHVTNLDSIAKGTADEDILWQWAGGVLTWQRVAEKLGCGVDEMAAQRKLMDDLVDRFERTGRVLFTGLEYQLAKDGVGYMDDLAEVVDLATAVAAVEWSEATVNKIKAQLEARQRTAERAAA